VIIFRWAILIVPPFPDSTKKFVERAFADRVLPAQVKDWYPSFGFFQNTDYPWFAKSRLFHGGLLSAFILA